MGRRGFALVLSIGALACGSSTVTETTSGGTGGSAGGTSSSGEFDAHLLECGAEQICPLMGYQSYAPPNPPSLPDAEEYACALASLRDRTPSLLVISSGCEGSCSGEVYLIREDGTALRQSWFDNNSGEGEELAGLTVQFSDWSEQGDLCQLKEPAFYDSCDFADGGDCDRPSEWFVSCEDATTMSCTP